MIIKNSTACCALAQLCANNGDSLDDLKDFIDEQRKQAKEDWSGSFRPNGQQAIFCVTTPREGKLEVNLAKLGFECLKTFSRRVGYGKGLLKYWWLDLSK